MASLTRFSFYTNAMMTFGYIYYVECAIKLLGLGIGDYFAVHWVLLMASDCDRYQAIGSETTLRLGILFQFGPVRTLIASDRL